MSNDSSLGSAVSREYVHSTVLQKSGGTMSGNINLNSNDITGLPNTPSTNSSAISKTYLDNKLFLGYVSNPSLIDFNMNDNYIINLKDPIFPDYGANKRYVDDKTSKIIIYKDIHFKSVGRTTGWDQVSTAGFPFLPLEIIINSNSKTVITVLSIPSDKDTRTSKQSGLLDSTIKILLKYYMDDGTAKSFGEVTIGNFKMSDFRYHEITDGTSTAIVYVVNIKYVLSHSISNYTDIKYETFEITQTISYVEENEVMMSLRYEDFE